MLIMNRLLLLSGFNEFYSGTAYEIKIVDLRQVNFPSNFYVYESTFYRISLSSIYMQATTTQNLAIDMCSFNNCSSTTHGGAIFFDCSSGGSISLKAVCGYKCIAAAGQQGQFIYCTTATNKANLHLLTSIAYSNAPLGNNNLYALIINQGNCTIQNVNVSNNQHKQYSGIHCSPTLFNTSYVTIFNNTVSAGYVYYITSSYAIVRFTNFVMNNHSSNGYIILGYHQLFDSCIFHDNYPCIFQGNNITLLECSVDHKYSYVALISITLTKWRGPATSILMSHFSSQFCFEPSPTPHQSECYPEPTPAQTMPPEPTDCSIQTNSGESRSLVSLFQFLFINTLQFFLF